MQRHVSFCLLCLMCFPLFCGFSQDRFPQPEFQGGCEIPPPGMPPPRSNAMQCLDAAALFLALCASSHLALKARSRRGILALASLSLAYFGFWRQGCVCSVGSIQNMALALADPGYKISPIVVAFFSLPLFFALLFGRTFCAAVCPLGCIQELAAVRPLRVPAWLAEFLGLLPHVYLATAVLFAATGSLFPICRYDPFVGFFRMSADFPMLALGTAFLGIGVFVARPYCRFLCPYSVLLSAMSRLSRSHVAISPGECVRCRLCERSCPIDVIAPPSTKPRANKSREAGITAALLLLAPVLTLAASGLGFWLATPFSRCHPKVALAEAILRDEDTLETKTFRAGETSSEDLFREADAVRRRFEFGSTLWGAYLGLACAIRLLSPSLRRRRDSYSPDRGRCTSCARCFSYCPVRSRN